jgi:hypothetical protein
MLQAHPELTTLVAFDLDPAAQAIAARRLAALGAALLPVDAAPTPPTLPGDPPLACAPPPASASGEEAAASAGAGGASGSSSPTVYMVRGNYSSMAAVLSRLPAAPAAPGGGGVLAGRVDAAVMDLGVSSMQVSALRMLRTRFAVRQQALAPPYSFNPLHIPHPPPPLAPPPRPLTFRLTQRSAASASCRTAR